MLRYNFNNASGLAARQIGSSYGLSRYFFSRTETRNFDTANSTAEKTAFPNGVSHPTAWKLPLTSGGIASYTEMTITFSASLVRGIPANGTASTSIAFSATATIKGIAQMSGAVTPFTELSPKNLADAVWNAATSDYTIAGSTGKFLYSTKTNSDLIPAAL